MNIFKLFLIKLRFKKQDRIMMTTLLRKLWMNTMKLWKGTNNIACLIEALLSSFLFFLLCCSPPFYVTHSSLPILLLLLFSLPFFLSFLLVLFLLLVVSLLALPPLLPHAFSSIYSYFSLSRLSFIHAGPVSSPCRFPPSPSPSITSCLLLHLLLLFSLPSFFHSCWSCFFSLSFPS